MAPKLPQAMEVEKSSQWPIETNIDLHLQEDESSAGLMEEITEIQVDPNKPSSVVKIDKGLEKELAHVDMIGIHRGVMCHQLNIDPQAKPMHQK